MAERDLTETFCIANGPVALSRCQDYERTNVAKALQTTIDHLGGMGRIVSSGDRVLIKPNLIKGCPPEAHATTHPAVIEAVIRLVLDCGGRPVVGDSPAFGDLPTVAMKTGVAGVCRRYGVPLTPFDSPVTVEVSDPWVRKISIDRAALEADKIINVPKLKTHVQVGFTAAVKNLFGCVVGKRKVIWHFKAGDLNHRFGKMLLDVYKTLGPTLHVVDGVTAMEGNGPVNGKPRHLGLIAASGDGLSLDRVLCEITGIPLNSVETFAALKMHYKLNIDLNKIQIIGAPLSHFADKAFILPDKESIRFNLPRIAVSVLRDLITRYLLPASAPPP